MINCHMDANREYVRAAQLMFMNGVYKQGNMPSSTISIGCSALVVR